MDYVLQIGNYTELSEINICLCLNCLDVFIMRYICICQSHVFLCVFHHILHQYFI